MKDCLASLARPHELGVVLRHRGGHDDLGIAGHGVGVVPQPGGNPRGAEASEVRAIGAVRAAHGGAEAVTHQGQAAHPGAADGDEVKLALGPIGHGMVTARLSPVTVSSSTVASGWWLISQPREPPARSFRRPRGGPGRAMPATSAPGAPDRRTARRPWTPASMDRAPRPEARSRLRRRPSMLRWRAGDAPSRAGTAPGSRACPPRRARTPSRSRAAAWSRRPVIWRTW